MATRELTTIQIPRKDAERLNEIASELGVPRQSVIRWAIKAYAESFVTAVVTNSTIEIGKQAELQEAA